MSRFEVSGTYILPIMILSLFSQSPPYTFSNFFLGAHRSCPFHRLWLLCSFRILSIWIFTFHDSSQPSCFMFHSKTWRSFLAHDIKQHIIREVELYETHQPLFKALPLSRSIWYFDNPYKFFSNPFYVNESLTLLRYILKSFFLSNTSN